MNRFSFTKKSCSDIFPCMLGAKSDMNLLGKIFAAPFFPFMYVVIFTLTFLFAKR